MASGAEDSNDEASRKGLSEEYMREKVGMVMGVVEKGIANTQFGMLMAHAVGNLAELDIFAFASEQTFCTLYKCISLELKKKSGQLEESSLPFLKVLINTILVLCDKNEDLREKLISNLSSDLTT